MPGAKPNLSIPLRFDADAALQLIQRIRRDGHAAGTETAEGMDTASRKGKEAAVSFGDLSAHLKSMIGVTTGLGMISEAFGAIKEQAARAAEYIKNTAQQFAQLRETMRSIAALQGETPTNRFTVDQLNLSAQSQILTPQEFSVAQESFLQYGSGYVSKPGQPGTGRIEQTTVNQILPELYAYAKSRKISPDIASRLIAALIQTMPKGSAADDYKTQFMKVMEIAETSKGSAQSTLSQLTPLLAEGVGEGMAFGNGPDSVLQAARLIAVEQERNPEESFTYSRALLQELHHIHAKEGADAALGITEDMTVEQKVKTIGEAYQRSGVKSFADFIGPYAGDKIRGTGALQTALNQGVRGGMFQAMKDASEQVTGADLGARMSQYMESEEGKSSETEASIARESALRGAKWDAAEALKREAQLALIRETDATGRNVFERTGITDYARYAASKLGAGSREEQLVNERAMSMAVERAGVGGQSFVFQQAAQGGWNNDPNRQQTGQNANSQIVQLLEIANKQRDASAKRPLSTPPPRTGERP